MSKCKERPRRTYEIVNTYPKYATEEEKEKALCEAATEIYMVCKRYGMMKRIQVDVKA